MADDSKAKPKPKKKGNMMRLLLIGGGVLALGGGAAAGGFYFAKQAAAQPEHEGPRLVGKGESTEAPEDKETDAKYETTYFEVEKGFTSNLKEPDRYVELGLGLSTHYDQRVVNAVKKHEVAIRSIVLATLAEQSVEQVSTLGGKTQLQAQLKRAINMTLKAKEGFGGVDDVYFTNFIIQ